MQNKYKKIIKDILIIVIAASLFAVFYNLIRTDGINFIKTDKVSEVVSDDELFTSKKNDTIINNEKIINDTIIENTDIISDSVIAVNDSIVEKVENLDYDAIFKKAKKSTFGDFKVVTKEQIKRMLADENKEQFCFIDARSPEEYNKEHIGNAVNIFPYEAEEEVVRKIFLLPQDKILIVYCEGGNCDASHQVASLLSNFDFKRFFVYEGGWTDWTK